jgi:tetratricopeptide (TPR) repeat protein
MVLLGVVLAAISLAVPRAFARPASVYLRMLVVKEPATARQVADLLAQGTPFAHLAYDYSIDSTKKQGGFLGLVALKELQAKIRMLVERLKVGEFTGPVRVPEGFAFFQRTTMAHYAKAIRLIRSNKYREALDPLDADLVLNPDRVHSLEFKAYVLQQLGRIPEAKVVYREIIRQKPTNVLAHNNLGMLLEQEGKYADAVTLFERAIALDPTQNVVLYNLAWLYASRLHNPTKALGFIRQAIALQPNSAAYYAMLGDIYTQQGKWKQARIAVAKAAELAPNNTVYKARLAVLETSETFPKPEKTVVQPRAVPARPTPPHPVPKPAPSGNPVVSQSSAASASIKVVTHPGGADASRSVKRLLQRHGFPVTLHITDPKPMKGIRIYHKQQSIDAAQRIRNLIAPALQLRRLTWESQFDIIVYVGQ